MHCTTITCQLLVSYTQLKVILPNKSSENLEFKESGWGLHCSNYTDLEEMPKMYSSVGVLKRKHKLYYKAYVTCQTIGGTLTSKTMTIPAFVNYIPRFCTSVHRKKKQAFKIPISIKVCPLSQQKADALNYFFHMQLFQYHSSSSSI